MATAWYLYPISHGYITDYQGPGSDTPHYAEDVATPEHTELTAILSGTVKRADYQAWGGEIFIQPDDKSYPEYYMYHTDLNQVQAGQHVTAGQDIALSGGQTSGGYHPVTDGESTGPHTHLGWFTEFVTPPQTGETIPYGPDPGNLLQLAQNGGVGGGGMASNFAISPNIYSAVEPTAQQYGVPDSIWETVASVESGFNPTAQGDNGTSYGLFQLHAGGQLGELTAQQAYDPTTNARQAMPAIASAWSSLSGTFDPNSISWWEQFASSSGHPGGTPGDPVTDAEAQRLQAAYQSSGSSSASAGQQCQQPSNIFGWPGYWACQAQNGVAGTVETATAQAISWFTSSIGDFLLRSGVGLIGVFLILLGTKDIIDALKDNGITVESSNNQQSGKSEKAAPAKRESKKQKRTEKKERKAEKKEEKKENDQSDKPEQAGESESDAAASSGAGAGAGAESGASASEVAAAAAV